MSCQSRSPPVQKSIKLPAIEQMFNHQQQPPHHSRHPQPRPIINMKQCATCLQWWKVKGYHHHIRSCKGKGYKYSRGYNSSEIHNGSQQLKVRPGSSSSSSRRNRKKTVDPNAPKKPRNGYLLFCADHRPAIKNAYPHYQ